MRVTRTVASLEISDAAFEEIKGLLLGAGYGHVVIDGVSIDMHGIALVRRPRPAEQPLEHA